MQSVSIGQKVVVSPFVDENEEFTGKVTEVNPSIDEKGQVKIRARIRNRGNVLMEGMNVKVVIEKEVPDMFVVPKDAVVMRDGFHVLFRLEEGHAVWTYVDVVYSNISQYAVTGNARKETKIEDGDVVITSGNLNLALAWLREDGQLSESPLTAKDIKKIEQSFLKTLSAQYHERVEYPPLEEKTSEQQV